MASDIFHNPTVKSLACPRGRRGWFSQSDCAKLGGVDPPFALDPNDVLAQPTRARLFAMLTELKRPAGTVELAERLDLHPNGVRVHLERLEEQGLVRRSRERRERGRPRDAWTIAPDAQPGGDRPAGYVDLGRWLARAIRSGPARLRDVERAGRDIGRGLAPGDAKDGKLAMEATLTALGFQPRSETAPGGHVTHCLGNCPYRDAVRENQPVVCTLHRGITRGLIDVLLPGARLADFVPRDPDDAGCLIELDRVPTEA
jgi:predicted ArsR family transcriptional regulator